MLKSSSLTVLAAVLAASCTTLGPDFKRPDAPTATGYAMQGDKIADAVTLSPDARTAGPWWNALGSAELDTLIRQAIKDSPDIAYAEANVRAALADTSAVAGAQAPQIDLTQSGAARTRINTASFGFTGFPSPTINLYQLGVSGRYDFDIFGKKRRATEAAAARAEAERHRADAVYLELTTNVAMTAVTIATIQAKIDSLNVAVGRDNEVVAMIKKAQAAGGAAASASTLGETQLAQDLADIPPLQRQLSEARHRMALLLGKSPAEWAPPAFKFTDFTVPDKLPVAIPSTLVRVRPDILRDEATFHAATADIGVATAAKYPDISLTANLTQGAIEPGDLLEYNSSGWSIAAAVAGPIFHGHTLKEREKQAIAKAEAAGADYRRTVIKAFAQVADVLSGIAADNESIAAYKRSENAYRSNVEDTRRAYELGAGALVDIYVAGRELPPAERRTIDAEGLRLQNVIRLFAVTGADWR